MKEKLTTAGVIIFWIIVIVGGIWWFGQSNSDSSDSDSNSQTVVPDSAGYDNCTDAHNAGVYDIPESSPAYKSKQDADHDGVACEHYLGN